VQTRARLARLADQRGIALPLALVVLMILASTTVAFVAMSATEPRISANLHWGAQALGLAEAGVERAIWALSYNNLTMPAAAPYDGSAPNATLGPGEYRMIVAAGAGVERNVTAEGYVPSQANPRGFRRILVTLTSMRNPDPPCALCVRGTVQASGSSSIDARTSTCGSKKGISITTTSSTGQANSLTIGGSSDIYGADGNNTPNQSTDYQTNLTQAEFDTFTFTQDELNLLKSLAKKMGTYIKPASTDEITWQSGDWNPPTSDPNYATKPKDGLIFVDTVNGQPLGPPGDPGNPDKLARLKITGTGNGGNKGWLIVMGSLRIDGDVNYKGLVYVMNDIVYRGTGTGGIEGAMITQNIVDSVQTVVDSSTLGNANIHYNCDYVKNGNGTIPTGYFVKPGTWREVSG
jgi:Tfp pilus assembly protein PilX